MRAKAGFSISAGVFSANEQSTMPESTNTPPQYFQFDLGGRLHGIYTAFGGSDVDFAPWYETIANAWYLFSIISFVFSAALLIGAVYSMIRFFQLRAEQDAALLEEERAFKASHAARGEESRWQATLAHVSSDNPNDWRIAIVEADIMLEELLDSLGYVGATISDKLKTVRPEAFRGIEDAWEAHKVRNAIAHQGSDFVLTKRAVQETIARYQRVFEEFKFI